MAFTFEDESTDRVDFGSATNLDNLVDATYLLWIKPLNVTAEFNGILTKFNNSFLQGISLHTDIPLGSGVIGLDVNDTTFGRIQIRSNAVFTAGTWQLLAITVDHDVEGNNDIFRGTLTSSASSVFDLGTSVYVLPVAYDDSANNYKLGGVIQTDTSVSYGGDYASVAIFNRVLSLGEIIGWQWRPQVLSGCVGFYQLGWSGISSVPDLSGNGNTGSVSGVTLADHVALPPAFGFNYEQGLLHRTSFSRSLISEGITRQNV